MMPDSPKLGAVAVVIHNNSVLLVQRRKNPNKGLWGFPGGHVELGETGLECAARELLEETGITARPVRYVTNIDLIRYADKDSVAFHYLLAVVECQYQNGEPVAADDAENAAWFSIPNLIADNEIETTDNVQEITLMIRPEYSQDS